MPTLYPTYLSPTFLAPTLFAPFERMVTATIPTIDLRETADDLIVTACLPGVDPHDIQVQAEGNRLAFFGQQQRHLRQHYRYSASYEQFRHVIPLPVAVSDRQVQVAYRGDRLVVTLPKAKTPLGFSILPELQNQGQNLNRQWRRAKTWLGHRLQNWGDRLL